MKTKYFIIWSKSGEFETFQNKKLLFLMSKFSVLPIGIIIAVFDGIKRNSIFLPKLFWSTVRKNCSSDQEKRLRSLEQFIQTVKGQNNFW